MIISIRWFPPTITVCLSCNNFLHFFSVFESFLIHCFMKSWTPVLNFPAPILPCKRSNQTYNSARRQTHQSGRATEVGGCDTAQSALACRRGPTE